MKLTPHQEAALACAREHGRLELWPARIWTYAGCPARAESGYVKPDTAFTWQTIKALLDRGLVRRAGTGTGYITEVEPVP